MENLPPSTTNSTSTSDQFTTNLRSKSLTNLSEEKFTPGEIRRIRERLLRTQSRIESATFKNLTKKQKMTLASLALVDFMCFCSMSIMAPFFPKEATEKGLSDTLNGFIFSFYALIMFIISPIFGKILPKIGAKTMFLNGILLTGLCNLLFGFLEFVDNYTLFTSLCIIIRGFEALGAAAFSTASYVFVVNSFPKNIGAVLGILETFVGLGMSIGPALGGILYSLGGFDLPFFVLGIAMILIIPLNIILLPTVDECNVTTQNASILNLIKLPAVIAIGLVIVIISSCWSFLDPTLEPHLRQYQLSAEKIGLIFLMFSALYGISSPLWGWLADKCGNHWSMMVIGLIFTTIGFLLLGPCPYLTFLNAYLWLDIVALSILGVSVALALLPTFQSILTSAINGGFPDAITTYSLVAGIWSCMYSLGEVIGPLFGGFLLQSYGFPIATTIMALMTLLLAVILILFFSCKSNCVGTPVNSTISITSSNSLKNISDESSETTPLLLSSSNGGDDENNYYRNYNTEKIAGYEQSRKYDNQMGLIDNKQVTDVRGTVAITSKGACEV